MSGLRKLILQLRRDNAADWATANPVLRDGELAAERVPEADVTRLKIGDGVLPWTQLPYIGATDLGVNGITSPTLSSIVVVTEADFAALTPDPTTAYLVIPNP